MSTDETPLLELRRSRKKFIARTIETYGTMIGAAVVGSLIFGSGWGRILSVVAAVVIAFAISLAYHRRARVFVTASRFGSRGWLGTWWTPRADLSRVVLVEQLTSRNAKGYRELYLFDRADKRVARLSGRIWGNKHVARVAHALSLPLSTVDRPITVKELVAVEPRALRVFEHRPWLLVAIFFAVVALIIVSAVARAR